MKNKKNIAQSVSEAIINTMGTDSLNKFNWNAGDFSVEKGNTLADQEVSENEIDEDLLTYKHPEHDKNTDPNDYASRDKRIKDESDASAHVHKELSHEAKDHYLDHQNENLPLTHRAAIINYTGGGYDTINKHLRHGDSLSKYHEDSLKNLKELTSQTTKHKFHVYRGINTKVGDLHPGSIIHDKGFTSTSILPSITHDFGSSTPEDKNTEKSPQHFRIRIKPGTKGHYVSGHNFSYLDGKEREFLLHPGTKFKVGKSYKHSDGVTYTNLHIHSQED